MNSYLRGYEAVLKDITTTFTVMYQKNKKAYTLTILYDDFGKEIVRDTEKHETELEAFTGLLAKAYGKLERDYIRVQKDVYGALNEAVPSEEFLKGQFSQTTDAREILNMLGGPNGD